MAGGAISSSLPSPMAAAPPAEFAHKRSEQCFHIRLEAAQAERSAPVPVLATNGDESLYANRIGNFSKGLPHNQIGEVDPAAYHSLLNAIYSGDPADFERIVMGGNTGLVNPQAGLAFRRR